MRKLLKEWQHRLGLDNWTIVLEEDCSPLDFKLTDVQGEADYDEVNRCAIIRIVSEKDYGKRIVPFDKEKVLVHELLHLKFCHLQNTGDNLHDRIVHQIIDDMARALVGAKRTNSDRGF